jgi:1-acyl-sn-glycerol-3-phosphate acyltransferase
LSITAFVEETIKYAQFRHVYGVSKRAWILRIFLRFIGKIFIAVFTRTTVKGLENIPMDRPVVFAANHASSFDPLIFFMFLPREQQIVGAGDFRMAYPSRIIMEWTDIILVNRGYVDRTALRAMTEVLKRGGRLALFPEGGSWEKRLTDVKNGAAYLSWKCNVPIVPIAISGTYDIWQKIWDFKRPRVQVEVLPPLPPVEADSARTRTDDLYQASLDLMHLIFEHLDEAEQNRYRLHERQYFTAQVDTQPDDLNIHTAYEFNVVGELISKKNLFSTFHEHAKLPVMPMLHYTDYYPAQEWVVAIEAMEGALTGNFSGYLPYRLGDIKAQRILKEFAELKKIAQAAADRHLKMRMTPSVEVMAEPVSDERFAA